MLLYVSPKKALFTLAIKPIFERFGTDGKTAMKKATAGGHALLWGAEVNETTQDSRRPVDMMILKSQGEYRGLKPEQKLSTISCRTSCLQSEPSKRELASLFIK
jgi:hypothetical protein